MKALDKSALLPLRLTAAVSVADPDIYKKVQGLRTTILIITNKETKDIMKIVKYPEESRLLVNADSKIMENEA